MERLINLCAWISCLFECIAVANFSFGVIHPNVGLGLFFAGIVALVVMALILCNVIKAIEEEEAKEEETEEN